MDQLALIEAALREAGLRPDAPLHETVLVWLRAHPRATVKEVAAAVGVKDAAAGRALAMLLQSGDVARGKGEGEKCHRYVPIPKGKP